MADTGSAASRRALSVAYRTLVAYRVSLVLEGTGYIPRTGPAVLAGNHVSAFDAVLVALALQAQGRDVAVAGDTVGPALAALGGDAFARAARSAVQHVEWDAVPGVLAGGGLVATFPEIAVSPSLVLTAFSEQASTVARDARVPLLPFAVWGSQRLVPPSGGVGREVPVTLSFGPGLDPQPEDDVLSLTDGLVRLVRGLSARAERTYPDRPRSADDSWWLPDHVGGTAVRPDAAGTASVAPAVGVPAARGGFFRPRSGD